MTPPTSAIPARGEVWLVRFDPSVGAEIQKVRPTVVVNVQAVGRLPLSIVVPLTDWKPIYSRFPWFVHVAPTAQNGLPKDSGADAFQVKSVAVSRFDTRLGILPAAELDTVVAAIALCIEYAASTP
jgi:mRNA interferase MazF